MSQTDVSGNGSAAAPFTVMTVVDLPAGGLSLTETLRVVAGLPDFRIDRRLTNLGAAPQARERLRLRGRPHGAVAGGPGRLDHHAQPADHRPAG